MDKGLRNETLEQSDVVFSTKEERAPLLPSPKDEHRKIKTSLCGRIVDGCLAFRRKKIISVEVAVFMYCFAFYLTGVAGQQFIYQYYEVKYLRASGFENFTISGMCLPTELQHEPCSEDGTTVQHCVQRDTSYLVRNITVVSTVIMCFAIIFIGPLSDKLGRKIALILPAVGAIVTYSLTLLLIYFELPISMVVIGGAIAGLSGGQGATLVGGFTYVSDITTPRLRTLRIGVINAMLFISGALSTSIGGAWLNSNACTYEHLYWFALAISILEIIYIIFGFPESIVKSRQNTPGVTGSYRSRSCVTPRQWLGIFKKAILKFCNGLKIFLRLRLSTFELWLSLIGDMLFTINAVAKETFFITFFQGFPLFWDPITIGSFTSMIFGLSGVSVIVLLPVLSLGFKFPDPLIALLGTVPGVMVFLMVAYLGDTLALWSMFLLGACSCLNPLLNPAWKSWMSKRVGKDEQGSLFSCVGCLEVAMAAIAAALYNTLYPALRQDIFYLMSGLYALVIPELLVLLVIHGLRVHFSHKQIKRIDQSSQHHSGKQRK